MFSPVGVGGMCVKIAPPLMITKETLEEILIVLDEVLYLNIFFARKN